MCCGIDPRTVGFDINSLMQSSDDAAAMRVELGLKSTSVLGDVLHSVQGDGGVSVCVP
jgi:hypothetical protein